MEHEKVNPTDDRLELMRERQEYFMAIAEEYTSFSAFIDAHGYWLKLLGIQLAEKKDCVTLRIELEYNDYEEYRIYLADDGHLSVSDIIAWNDDYCCNALLNLTTGKSANEEAIPGGD